MKVKEKADTPLQVTLNIDFDSNNNFERYKTVYSKLYDLCFDPGKSIPSGVLVRREEYAPNRHVAFIAMGRVNAEEVVRKAKESGLVTDTHIDVLG
jgi:hypothetical protein